MGLVHCHAEPLVTKETYAPYILSLSLRRRPAVAGSSRGKQTAHDNEVQGNRSPKMDCVLNERNEYSYEQRDRFLVRTPFTVTRRNSQPFYLSGNLTTSYVTRSTLKQERPQRISERSLPSPPAFVPGPGFAGYRRWQTRFPKPPFRDPLTEVPRINAINRSRPIRLKSETDSLRKTVVFVVANKVTNQRTARTVRELGKFLPYYVERLWLL
jgi:hypothetical protein